MGEVVYTVYTVKTVVALSPVAGPIVAVGCAAVAGSFLLSLGIKKLFARSRTHSDSHGSEPVRGSSRYFDPGLSQEISEETASEANSLEYSQEISTSYASSEESSEESSEASEKPENEISSLEIGFLNVNSLKKCLSDKSKFNKMVRTVKEYDILLLAETKCDVNDDIPEIDGYTFRDLPRKSAYKSKSGGLGAFVKDSVDIDEISASEETDYVQWLKISGKRTVNKKDIIIGGVYIPPKGSEYFKEGEYERFERNVEEICNNYELVYLLGDFNARIGEMNTITEEMTQISRRQSRDHVKSGHNRKLMELCENNNLKIANGNICGDAGKGEMTFRDKSVIDYMLYSAEGRTFVDEFDIKTRSPLSDGHALLECKIDFHKQTKMKRMEGNVVKRPKRDER